MSASSTALSKVFQGSEMKFRFELNALAFALAGAYASLF